MGQLILILGGARSGKSAYGERLARERGGAVLFVATATAGDDEMAQRIATHRAERPAAWRTLEAPTGVASAIATSGSAADTILLDCVTLLVSNLLLAHEAEGEAAIGQAIDAEFTALLARIDAAAAAWIVVSNEVGMGLVPPYPLGRAYRDLLGRVNARLAARADRAYLLVAGLPLDLKRLMAD
ncbi:MAG TPA: bifunctional adenosylcobinamide kinase/adenosylcobinamide-phosphate guanylyltransferase [Thermomicrobiales bacterium]